MKAIPFRICVGLVLATVALIASSMSAAETREASLEADSLFPKRRCVAEFKEGMPHGICRAFDDQNRLILTEDYVSGRVHGKRVCYYPSGKKFSEMTFENGLAEGETTTWYEDGTIASVDHMQQGLPNGLQTLYFRNGKKRTETPHVNAVVHGTCRHYLPSGKLFGLSTFEDGIEISKQIIIEPSAGEYKTIVDAGQFSPFLKDHWTSNSDSKPGSPVGSSNKDIRQGDQVQVEWKGKWYPATVVRIEKRGYLIHYTGFDASWDEYVWKNRIR